MLKYLMLWYRAKTYCPVIDSLYSEPEMWVEGAAYKAHKAKGYKARYRGDSFYLYTNSSSIYHKELDIEIEHVLYYQSLPQHVIRNGHKLPVHKARLKRVLKMRELQAQLKVIEAARAELNRVTQDAQTLRLARITELRKSLAVAEAADFAYRLEHE